MATPAVKPIGTTGLTRSGGLVDDEFLTLLKGDKGRAFYREMQDNSWVVGVILYSIKKLLQRLNWIVEPVDPDDAKAVEIAEFVESCRDDMTDTWDVTLTDILSMLTYGWSWQEVVYKRRGGESKNPQQHSRYSDGKVGWRKWAPRAQTTLQDWVWDEDGDVAAMTQMDNSSNRGTVTIPIERSLLFRFEPERGNPEGRSMLRNAAISYYYGKKFREIEAIGIERDLAGLPVAYVPQEWLAGDASAENLQSLAAVQNIIEGVKRNENEGVILPHLFTDDGKGTVRTVNLELLSTGGSRQFDVDAVIGRYDREIATSVLMDFLLLGHEAVGSKALAVSKIDLWLSSVSGLANTIADTVNRHAIPKLVALNGWDTALSPTLTYGALESSDLSETAEQLKTLLSTGAIMPDEVLDDWTRDTFGLPPRDLDKVTEE